MITAVFGKCNGVDIVFVEDDQGRWTTAVPASDTKLYVIEIWAVDHAGNVSYFATIEATYDPSTLRMQFRVVDVGANFTMDDVLSKLRWRV